MNNYTDMTDEEYNALDEELTVNPQKIISNGSDWLSQREIRIRNSVLKVPPNKKIDFCCKQSCL